MRQKSETRPTGAARAIKDIRRATRKQYSAEEKIRIVLDGLRGEETIAELCRREGIAQSIYYKWSKEFLEAGKRRLAGDTARAASTGEIQACLTSDIMSFMRLPSETRLAEPCVGLRLCTVENARWQIVQDADHDRRVHAGMPCPSILTKTSSRCQRQLE